MAVSYNQIAGQSAERLGLAALSDSVFAVAMTLLLLELRVPAREMIHSERDLLRVMATFLPQLAVYLCSCSCTTRLHRGLDCVTEQE